MTRLLTSGSTAGIGGPIVSFVEASSSIVISFLAINAPNIAILLVVFLVIDGIRRIVKFNSKRKRKRTIKEL